MVLIVKDDRLSKKVFFALKNTFFGVDNIAWIKNIWMDMKEKKNDFLRFVLPTTNDSTNFFQLKPCEISI